MKLLANALKCLAAAAVVLPHHSAAWDEDPRCTGGRKLFNTDEPDPRPVQDGLPIDGIRARPRTTRSDSTASANGLLRARPRNTHDNTTEIAQVERYLRGDHSRRLASITRFQLKMYHELGYCWQDEWEDARWCLECEGSACGADDYLWVMRCDKDEKDQWFVYREISGTDGGHLSPYRRQDLCWERTRVNAHQLRPCSSEPRQIIVGLRFDDKFEMHPNGKPDDCLSQHHDPKSKEIVRAEDCKEARKDNTNFWIMVNKRSGDDNGGGGDDPPPGSDTINDLGSEYCETHLCQRCQGDCDGDSQCEGSLKCFQRSGDEKVPGCKGGTDGKTTGKDFCYEPADDGTINFLGSDYCNTRRCKRCQGDCDDDGQCEGSLKCFQRNGNEKIPGCKGGTDGSTTGRDFCYDPGEEQPDGSDTINDLGSEYCDDHLCKRCQGDCDGDSQCEGKLKCFQRNGNEKVPGCKGSTDGKTSGKDFCYDPDDRQDDDDPPDGSDTIQDLGWEYCDTHACQKCQGDCDSDNHCAGSLKCFQRDGIQKVPGCKGSSAESTRNKDFCYDPNDASDNDGPRLEYLGREYCDGEPCDLCQGDCDKDSHCRGDLVCFQRSGTEPVPGCSGGDSAETEGKDFCIRP